MLTIKKIVCIVSILLVSVLCLSIVVRTTSIGTAGPINEGGYSGIGLPENGVNVLTSAAPVTFFHENVEGAGTLKYENFSTYSLIEGSTTDKTSYFSLNFSGSGSHRLGFNLADYGYYKVEFDIAQLEGYNPTNCSMYLIARSQSNQGDKLRPSQFTIAYDERDGKMQLTYGDHTVKDDSFHIEYVIEANPLDFNMSRIQFFVNGNLIPENEYNEIVNFRYDLYYFSELRLWQFGESDGKLIIKDLQITGYPND